MLDCTNERWGQRVIRVSETKRQQLTEDTNYRAQDLTVYVPEDDQVAFGTVIQAIAHDSRAANADLGRVSVLAGWTFQTLD